jgi:hypothetical protein
MLENMPGFSPCGIAFLPSAEFFRSLFNRAIEVRPKRALAWAFSLSPGGRTPCTAPELSLDKHFVRDAP